jgi:hypothetical protein
MRPLRVIVGCEESQEVTKAFRARGHEAYSCDLLPCSGGHPEWHLKGDVMDFLWYCKWDIGIFFPACTYVCFAGIRWNVGNPERVLKTHESIIFFESLWNSDIPKIAIENPVGVIPKHTGIKWSQMIHPWQHGHGEQKKTCLWLKGLPLLEPTDIVEGREQRIFKMAPSEDRSKLRSKTFPGIAKAMAAAWSEDLTKQSIC